MIFSEIIISNRINKLQNVPTKPNSSNSLSDYGVNGNKGVYIQEAYNEWRVITEYFL